MYSICVTRLKTRHTGYRKRADRRIITRGRDKGTDQPVPHSSRLLGWRTVARDSTMSTATWPPAASQLPRITAPRDGDYHIIIAVSSRHDRNSSRGVAPGRHRAAGSSFAAINNDGKCARNSPTRRRGNFEARSGGGCASPFSRWPRLTIDLIGCAPTALRRSASTLLAKIELFIEQTK